MMSSLHISGLICQCFVLLPPFCMGTNYWSRVPSSISIMFEVHEVKILEQVSAMIGNFQKYKN